MNAVWQACPDDWETFMDVRLESLADAPDAFGSTLRGEITNTETDWRQRLTKSVVFLGSRNGKVQSIASAFPLEGDEVELTRVWTHPDARGTGLAAETVGAVLNWAKGKTVTLWVGEKNVAAERFYTKLGFERTGKRGSLPRDESIMEVEMILRPDAQPND
ncbi:GNAT family N-acetyltransferase [Kibdelosporangium aridum]|uniref:Acetyltransferase (GNAT) domain-containing protein n=1 Tax=Kibdelosporangium aridum TaxID=2030 RepID=A0A1Y5XWV9_KIBAR|nr:GNAT family N-acetyltransferase [Kibdelosporangium aridum]SMD15953.1 Acetyltransferase (GNAT) domain-containing protein [Kibdelosporangium aridum]